MHKMAAMYGTGATEAVAAMAGMRGVWLTLKRKCQFWIGIEGAQRGAFLLLFALLFCIVVATVFLLLYIRCDT